jgi:hypothetical protein
MFEPGQLPRKAEYFVEKLCVLGRRIRSCIVEARANQLVFSDIDRHSIADTIYAVDNHVEPVLIEFCEQWGQEFPLVLVAEGIEGDESEKGMLTFPRGSDPDDAAFQLIVDPIDGTRGLMFDKRSAWVLAGVAPNHSVQTRLSHISVAMQAEIPVSKQTRCDVLWAGKGRGAMAVRDDLLTEETYRIAIAPSKATDIAHGFGSVTSFFPGTKVLSAELLELIARQCAGNTDASVAMVFDDQYISTGGQFYELIMGHDRFNADLRLHFYRALQMQPGLCVHPYDMATALIAQEAGVILSDGLGGLPDAPLDVTTPLAWSAFANAALRDKIEPIIINFLKQYGAA